MITRDGFYASAVYVLVLLSRQRKYQEDKKKRYVWYVDQFSFPAT